MAIDPKRLYLNECKKFTIEKKILKRKKLKKSRTDRVFNIF